MATNRITLLILAVLLLCGGTLALYFAFVRFPQPDLAQGRHRIAQLESGERPLSTEQTLRILQASVDYVDSAVEIADSYRRACRLFGLLMLAGAVSQFGIWWAMRRGDSPATEQAG